MVPIVEEFKRRLTVSGIGSDYDSDTNRANASPQAGPGHDRAPPDDADCECAKTLKPCNLEKWLVCECALPVLRCAAWLDRSTLGGCEEKVDFIAVDGL